MARKKMLRGENLRSSLYLSNSPLSFQKQEDKDRICTNWCFPFNYVTYDPMKGLRLEGYPQLPEQAWAIERDSASQSKQKLTPPTKS